MRFGECSARHIGLFRQNGADLGVKYAVNYIGAFEKALATEARHHQSQGSSAVTFIWWRRTTHYGLRHIDCGDWDRRAARPWSQGHWGKFEIVVWT